MKWSSAIAMDSVLITHFLAEKTMNIPMIANEISLFLIGAGIGVLLNLSLRPKENALKDKMAEADESIRAIIQRMAERIRTLDRTNYDGSCFLLLDKVLHSQTWITHLARRHAQNLTMYKCANFKVRCFAKYITAFR